MPERIPIDLQWENSVATFFQLLLIKSPFHICFKVLFVLCFYKAQISGERLQDHWSSGLFFSSPEPKAHKVSL